MTVSEAIERLNKLEEIEHAQPNYIYIYLISSQLSAVGHQLGAGG
jgi:hypothetical protein